MRVLIKDRRIKNALGRFIRTRRLWRPENWDNGYIDSRGYFRVYRPDYPGCWNGGYAKRAVVVYWLVTGHVVAPDENVHHRNGNRMDDRFENLRLLLHRDHACFHNPKESILTCQFCGRRFNRPRGKSSVKIRFCSQRCYHASPRSEEHKQNIRLGLCRAYAEGRK